MFRGFLNTAPRAWLFRWGNPNRGRPRPALPQRRLRLSRKRRRQLHLPQRPCRWARRTRHARRPLFPQALRPPHHGSARVRALPWHTTKSATFSGARLLQLSLRQRRPQGLRKPLLRKPLPRGPRHWNLQKLNGVRPRTGPRPGPSRFDPKNQAPWRQRRAMRSNRNRPRAKSQIPAPQRLRNRASLRPLPRLLQRLRRRRSAWSFPRFWATGPRGCDRKSCN